ncbi:DUF2779 domain-containing protein [Candidatus Woesearchaeota archaeon]|nr:DUF2779 domain-containing protein [Candidatus Woesearchaeota archaeon]
MKLLTKSKYLIGLQCKELLWVSFNDPDSLPEVSVQQQHIFDQGHIIGELAKQLYPEGVDLTNQEFSENIRKTKFLMRCKKVIFEAGLILDNLYARADILVPNGDGYDILEVKSSTRVKDINIHDLSFQKKVFEDYGTKIKNCFLVHINNQYVKQGKIIPEDFFTITDCTEMVEEYSEGIDERIDEMLKIIRMKEKPSIKLTECLSVYDCPIHDLELESLPEGNVFQLYRGGALSTNLFEEGIIKIKDIPEDTKLNSKQKIQLKCEKDNEVYVDKEKIKKFIDDLEEPLYFLDFETFNPAIPLFDNMRPYQRVPFQFSLHILKDGKLEHHEFLYDKKDDPRFDFGEELSKLIGKEGSIIVFNQSFEMGVLKELEDAFPFFKEMVSNISKRVVDLIIPFRNFNYYNSKQKGSCSIKKILPALTNKSYEDLDIANGADACVLYPAITYNEVTKEEKEKVRKDLLEYCKLDTEAMVWILEELKKLSS